MFAGGYWPAPPKTLWYYVDLNVDLVGFDLVLDTYRGRDSCFRGCFGLNFLVIFQHGGHFLLLYAEYGSGLGIHVVGPWQWPYRGVRVGEASHPGPASIDLDVDAT